MDRLTRRATHEDKFARHLYCKRARLNYIRYAKKANRKKLRRIMNSQAIIDN